MVLSKSLESCVKVSCGNLGWKDVILTELNTYRVKQLSEFTEITGPTRKKVLFC